MQFAKYTLLLATIIYELLSKSYTLALNNITVSNELQYQKFIFIKNSKQCTLNGTDKVFLTDLCVYLALF